jgi:hypothetical protein
MTFRLYKVYAVNSNNDINNGTINTILHTNKETNKYTKKLKNSNDYDCFYI